MKDPSSPPPPSLAKALEALGAAAAGAGIDSNAARAEGEALAAAVAESSGHAHAAWSEQTGHDEVQDFFDAAHRGRRWRAAPTVLLSELIVTGSSKARAYAEALADVSLAAQSLGDATPRTAGIAAMAAAAQLSAASPPQNPIDRTRDNGPDLDLTEVDPSTPGAFPGFGQSRLPEPESVARQQPINKSTDEGRSSVSADRVEAEPQENPKTLEELLAELDALIGLKDVKAEIHRQVAVLRVDGLRQKAGLKSPTITRHLVFVGNPGTGKTTVARLVGGIYRALGLLSKGQLVEVDRSELVAGYLGQTAIKTAEVVASAAGGVLFIDEAYSLAGDQYGTEAVDTLVKEMEDRRDDLVVIVAGYPDPMVIFITQNPGLASRFRTTIEFDDYTEDELIEIFLQMAKKADYDVTEDCLQRFKTILSSTPRGPMFGNGRFARNLLESAIGRHAWRLRNVPEPTVQQLRELMASDLDDQESTDVDPLGVDQSALAAATGSDQSDPTSPPAVTMRQVEPATDEELR